MILPLVFLVANAFKTPQEMLRWPPTIIPANPTLDNFGRAGRHAAAALDLQQSAVRVLSTLSILGDLVDRRLHPGQVPVAEC